MTIRYVNRFIRPQFKSLGKGPVFFKPRYGKLFGSNIFWFLVFVLLDPARSAEPPIREDSTEVNIFKIFLTFKMSFLLNISNLKEHNNKNYKIEFSMIGLHNIQNALATIAIGIELKIGNNWLDLSEVGQYG